MSKTGVTKDQLDEAARRADESWGYGEGMPHVLGPEVRLAAPFLVRPQERINHVADLVALCEAGDHYLAYLRDGGPTTADQADALSATVGRVRAVIGGAG